jgi:transposase-like protein
MVRGRVESNLSAEASRRRNILAFVVFCRLRYRLTLRDLSEILLLCGIAVSDEVIRDWENKLLPIMGNERKHARCEPHEFVAGSLDRVACLTFLLAA